MGCIRIQRVSGSKQVGCLEPGVACIKAVDTRVLDLASVVVPTICSRSSVPPVVHAVVKSFIQVPSVEAIKVDIETMSVDVPGVSAVQSPISVRIASVNNVFIRSGPRVAPPLVLFDQNIAVRDLLAMMVTKKTFVFSHLKRGMQASLVATTAGPSSLGLSKPSGLLVHEMFDPRMCQCGDAPLVAGSHPLQIEAIDTLHVASCDLCRPFQHVQHNCYFSVLRMTIVNGWKPELDVNNIIPLYNVKGNYPTVDMYSESVDKEFDKMVSHGVVTPASDSMRGVLSPMGAIVKNSDKVRAKVLTDVKVVDQKSLSEASAALLDQGFPEIKARIAVDLSASGVNRAAFVPPFTYPGVEHALSLITEGCWMAKADVSRYFFSFPVAPQCWWLFLVRLGGLLYFFSRCCFGFAPCPYYCSMWSAEFRSWMIAEGLPCAHMMDDWMTVGDTYPQAEKNIDRISFILMLAGFSMALEKKEIAQIMVYLGILINTITMTISFEKTQCLAMKIELEQHLATFQAGRNIDATSIRHVAGKINWYSEVLQSGRAHNRSWWLYHKHGRNLRAPARLKLIRDTQWWIDILDTWGGGSLSGVEYPILSAEVLLKEKKICVVQSDASGMVLDISVGF